MEIKKRKQNKWQKPELVNIHCGNTLAKIGGDSPDETAQSCSGGGFPPDIYWFATNVLHQYSPLTDIKHVNAMSVELYDTNYSCDMRGAVGPSPRNKPSILVFVIGNVGCYFIALICLRFTYMLPDRRDFESKWRRHITAQPDGDKRLWEVAVLSSLRDAFRSGDIWLRHSRRYADLKESLVPIEVVAT